MALVPTVTNAEAFSFSLSPFLHQLLVIATGTVPTSGWSGVRLSPRFYAAPPADGIWDFNLEADPPAGIVLQVIQNVTASGIYTPPPWLKGIRVHGADNKVEAPIVSGKATIEAQFKAPAVLKGGNVIYKRSLATYDDSFNPIGMCSLTSVKMKKLHHELTLTVEGPDEGKIRSCVEKSFAAGLVAAIIAAYVTGGAALSAAISAFIASLETCLGQGFSVRVDDSSHWIEWCT